VRVSAGVGLACLAFAVFVSALLPYIEDRAVEALSQAVAILGAALLGPAMVSGFLAVVQPWADRGSIIPRLAIGNLSRNVGRTSGNVVTLMVGLVMVILISAVNLSFRNSIGTWFKRILHADLLVSTNGRVAAHESQQLDESVRGGLTGVPGVSGVFGVRVTRVALQAPGEAGARNVGVKAFDPLPKTDKGYAVFDVQDRPIRESVDQLFTHTPGQPTPIMVSTSFVLHFGKKTGDTIELPAGGALHTFRIVAVMVDYFSPNGVIYLARPAYRDLFKDHLVSAFAIEVAKGIQAETVRDRIHGAFPREKRLTVISNIEMREQVDRTIDESFGYTKA
ncbi:MAG: ABC transporter permease, partial [Bdellovibrionota bacterium]